MRYLFTDDDFRLEKKQTYLFVLTFTMIRCIFFTNIYLQCHNVCFIFISSYYIILCRYKSFDCVSTSQFIYFVWSSNMFYNISSYDNFSILNTILTSMKISLTVVLAFARNWVSPGDNLLFLYFGHFYSWNLLFKLHC